MFPYSYAMSPYRLWEGSALTMDLACLKVMTGMTLLRTGPRRPWSGRNHSHELAAPAPVGLWAI